MSIRKKLLLAFGTIVLLSTMIGLVAFAINSDIKSDISQIRKAALHKAEGVSVMAESIRELQEYRQELLAEKYRAKSGIIQSDDSATITKVSRIMADTFKEFEDQGVSVCRQDATQDLELSESKGRVADVQEAREEIVMLDGIGPKFAVYKNDLERLANPNSEFPSEAEMARYSDDYDQVSDIVEAYEAKERGQLDVEAHKIEDSIRRANLMLLGFALLILGLSSFLIWYIDHEISYPIGLLKKAAQRISRGNLNGAVDLDSTNEFGLLAGTFNQMIHDLRTKTVSKDYVDSILKSMVNTLIVVRPDHTIQSINKATLQLLDYAEAELIGQSMDRVLQTPQNRPRSLLDEALEQGFVSNVDVIYQAKDARLRLMANPNPVPPYFRVVDASAWIKD